jgi:hypothetical protein
VLHMEFGAQAHGTSLPSASPDLEGQGSGLGSGAERGDQPPTPVPTASGGDAVAMILNEPPREETKALPLPQPGAGGAGGAGGVTPGVFYDEE